ncbi:uncharacterized protein MYCGRDRAFT_95085 [Zymoseptoria tritici IPO323]|uniref:Uncharacterized protein n=1 Tax=Zymoseptoria tritici (strain CBS 115943 / IPO323) TaxID=336722 RepID=F9XH94_ZYMTI|nr:uncharacterized protein MYCGRDRAFT_95085 [Zymoseptoria tritici IPO323]EGP85408.1 hypothetical protein MYCGRDRAFT_95085 [Zymoseptoria tritici IPO323]
MRYTAAKTYCFLFQADIAIVSSPSLTIYLKLSQSGNIQHNNMRFLAITFLGVFAHLAASAAVSPIEKRQGECIFTKCCDVNGHSTTFCFNWGERSTHRARVAETDTAVLSGVIELFRDSIVEDDVDVRQIAARNPGKLGHVMLPAGMNNALTWLAIRVCAVGFVQHDAPRQ